MEFDWDQANIEPIARHRITSEECEDVYRNGPLVIERRDRIPICYGVPDALRTPGFIQRGRLMVTRTRLPKFRSEKEEAEWWDAHPEVITALFLKAKKDGKIKRLPVVRGATKSVTLRLPIADMESARELAGKRGLPYQTYIKALLRQALQRERKVG